MKLLTRDIFDDVLASLTGTIVLSALMVMKQMAGMTINILKSMPSSIPGILQELPPRILVRRALGGVFLATSFVNIALASSAQTPPSTCLTGVPAQRKIVFTIVRNGDPIGVQIYRFTREGNRTTVHIRTDIDYRFLFLSLYRFRHVSKEIWECNKLASLDSDTDDNSDATSLKVRSNGKCLTITGSDGFAKVECGVVPASLWNSALLRRKRLLGTITGKVFATKADFMGSEVLRLNGRAVRTRHYRLTGQFNRNIWYIAANDVLARVRFEARDGSRVEYVRSN